MRTTKRTTQQEIPAIEQKQKLRVWWIPQVPMKAFRVEAETLKEAKLLLDTLANYDLFQFENKVKPDYSNAGGLEVFEDGEWTDWYDENGDDIDSTELFEQNREEASNGHS